MRSLKSFLGKTRLERKLRLATVLVVVTASYGLYWFLFQGAKRAIFRDRVNAVAANIVSDRNVMPKLVDQFGLRDWVLDYMPHSQSGQGKGNQRYYWRVLSRTWRATFSEDIEEAAEGGYSAPASRPASGPAMGPASTRPAAEPRVESAAEPKTRRRDRDAWETWAANKVKDEARIVGLCRLRAAVVKLAGDEAREAVKGIFSVLADPVSRDVAFKVIREWARTEQAKPFLEAVCDRLMREEFLIEVEDAQGRSIPKSLKDFLKESITKSVDRLAEMRARIAMWRFVMSGRAPEGPYKDMIIFKYSALSVDAEKIRQNIEATIEKLKLYKDKLQQQMQKGVDFDAGTYAIADEVGKFLTQLNNSLDDKTLRLLLAWNFAFPFFMQEYVAASKIIIKSELDRGPLYETLEILGDSKVSAPDKALRLVDPANALLLGVLSDAVVSGHLDKVVSAAAEVIADTKVSEGPFDRLRQKIDDELTSLRSGRIEHIENVKVGSLLPEIFPGARQIYRYVKPIRIEPGCMRCHAGLGYKAGDVLAGVEIVMRWLPEDAAVADLRRKLIAFIVVGAGAVTLASFFIYRRVVIRPLSHLTEVSRRVADGELSGIDEVKIRAEFEEFSSAFSRMLQEMEANRANLKRLNEDLNRKYNELGLANARLHRESEQKSMILSNTGHEFKTPLNSIIGFAEVLRDSVVGPLNERQKYYLENIRTSGKHLESMVNRLLEEARAKEGKLAVTVSRVDLSEVVNRAIVDLGPKSVENLTIKVDIPLDIPKITTDETKLHQILNNLIENAVKFTPKGGSVTIRARAVEDGVEIAVIDTGIGISPENQEIIFERFRQVDGSTTRRYSGLGIGLSLVKEFVTLLGGEISVESEPDKGSTFTVRLPLKIKTAAPAVLDETAAEEDSPLA